MNLYIILTSIPLLLAILVFAPLSVFVRLSKAQQGIRLEIYLFTLLRLFDGVISLQKDGLHIGKKNKVIPYTSLLSMKNAKHLHLIKTLKFTKWQLTNRVALARPNKIIGTTALNCLCDAVSRFGVNVAIHTQYTLFEEYWECSGNISTSIYAIIKQIIKKGKRKRNGRKSANTANS